MLIKEMVQIQPCAMSLASLLDYAGVLIFSNGSPCLLTDNDKVVIMRGDECSDKSVSALHAALTTMDPDNHILTTGLRIVTAQQLMIILSSHIELLKTIKNPAQNSNEVTMQLDSVLWSRSIG